MQLSLFTVETHLTPDYFLSGHPSRPDPFEEAYIYWNQRKRLEQAEPAEVLPLYTGYLVLCDPVEKGWKWVS